MNTYRVVGRYRLWDNDIYAGTEFDRVVLAVDVDDAIRICRERYQDAVVTAVVLRDPDILIREVATKLQEKNDEGFAGQIE